MGLAYCIRYSMMRRRMQHTNQSLLDTLVPEIRRGGIVLAVLAGLKQEEYGYSLKRWLADHGVEIDEGTLYPLLRRLESQGLLTSRWALEEQRPRRYYRQNAAGEALLRDLTREWKTFTKNIGGLLP